MHGYHTRIILCLAIVALAIAALYTRRLTRQRRTVLFAGLILMLPLAWIAGPGVGQLLHHITGHRPPRPGGTSGELIEGPTIASGANLAPVDLARATKDDSPEFLGANRANTHS